MLLLGIALVLLLGLGLGLGLGLSKNKNSILTAIQQQSGSPLPITSRFLGPPEGKSFTESREVALEVAAALKKVRGTLLMQNFAHAYMLTFCHTLCVT